jgi:hypothetical protein
MTADLTTVPTYLETLDQAAAAFWGESNDRPAAPKVVNALVQAEKMAKQQRLTYEFAALLGRWRLCFTAPRKAHQQGDRIVGKGFYVPKIAPAQISFHATDPATHQGNIGNQIQLGALRLKFTGPCRYISKKNLLAFDFTQLQLSLFDRVLIDRPVRSGKAPAGTFEQQAIAKLPFFAFFLVTENFIAARGRGGGLALWIRERE